MITKKDLDIIRQCLLQSGVRNSDFKTAKELKGDEYIAFIDKGQNQKIKVKDMGFARSLVIQDHEYHVDEDGNINISLADISPESCLTIRYKGESPIGISWNNGDLFYNTRTNKLFQSTPTGFKQVSLISGKIYYVQSNSSFYYYNSKVSSALIPFLLSGINIKTINGQPITGNGNLQISGEGIGTGASCITIYLKGDSYRERNINEGDDLWQIGDLWYDTDNEQLMQCVSKNPDTFEPVGFIDGSVYYVAGPPEEVEFFYYNSTVSEQPIHISNLTVDDVKVIAKPVIKKYTDNILPYDGIVTVQPEDYMSNYMQGHSGSMQIFYNSVDGHFIARSNSHPDLYYNNWTRTDSITRVTRTYEDYENVSFVYRIHNGNLFIYKVSPSGLVGINGLEGFKQIYNVSYLTDMQDNIPTGDAEHMYALDPDTGILYQWNESTGDWDAADRGDDPYSIIIYKGRIGYLFPDDFEWRAFISVPESYKIMEISGFLPSSTIIYREQDTYTGEEGEVILDLRSNMALLKVTNGTSTYYYSNWTAAGSHFSSDMYDISNTIFAYIEDGKFHMGIVKNRAFLEISGQNNITIDSALSATSNNPVRNSAIYNNVQQINSTLNSLAERVTSIGASSIMPIDGVVTKPYRLQNTEYTGTDGQILIDEANSRIILYVENTSATLEEDKGYVVWNNAGGRRPSNEYNINTQFFWRVDSDGNLHIGCYRNNRYIEVAGSESVTVDSTITSDSDNPVKSSTIYNALQQKQDTLISGTNVKTINGQSIVGEGDLNVSAMTVDSTISDTSVNPVENRAISAAIASAVQDLKNLIKLYHPEEEPTPSDDPTDPGEPNVYRSIFDSTVGNWGELNVNTTIDGEVVSLTKNVEKITPELMEAAWEKLNVDYLDDGVTLIEDIEDIAGLSEGEKFMITGVAAGFQTGSTSTIRENNRNLLKRIISTSDETFANCIGVKLEEVYELQGSNSSATNSRTLFIEKDFVIDGGNSEDEAIGGFHCAPSNLYTLWFSTSNSLNVRNAIFSYDCRDTTSGTIFSIRYNNFISQIQIIGCSFLSTAQNRAANTAISFLSDVAITLKPIETQIDNVNDALEEENEKEVKDTQKIAQLEAQLALLQSQLQVEAARVAVFVDGSNNIVKPNNAIDYVLIKNNNFGDVCYLQKINSNGGIRVNKGFLIQGNTFKGRGIIIDKGNGSNPSAVLGTELGYLSCPMFVVDNTFLGYTKICRPTNGSDYCSPINVNYQSLYVLHNNINDYMSGKNTAGNYAGTYDFYANSCLVYSCNNHIHNLVRFTKKLTDFGTIKAKGAGIPSKFLTNGLYVPPVRYYVENTYDVNKSEVLAIWNTRSTEYVSKPALEAYDNEVVDAQGNLREDCVFYLHMGGYLSTASEKCALTVFSKNTIKYPYVKPSAKLASDVIEINGNIFSGEEDGVAVPIKYLPEDGDSYDILQMFWVEARNRIDVIGNTFNFDNPIIDLLFIYSGSTQTYTGTRNVNVYNNILHNHSVLRYKYAGENYKVFSNIQNQTEVNATTVPTTESISLSDNTNNLQPVAMPENVLVNVNGDIYQRTAGSYVTNFFRFLTDETSRSFENLVFNNVVYTLKVTSTESVSVTINGKVDDIYQFRDIFYNALLDNGYTAVCLDGKSYSYCSLFVISNHFGTNSWNRSHITTPVTQDRSTGGKTDVKVFSVSPNIIMTSYKYEEYPGVNPYLDGENAEWTKISEGDEPIPVGPVIPAVNTVDDLPLDAKIGDQVEVRYGGGAGIYECEEEGTPCTVNFAFRTKASDSTLGVTCTFNNEIFNIPFYEDVYIMLTLNGTYTPEQIRDAFVTAACSQLGLDANDDREVDTKFSSSYQIAYAQLKAKENGASAWANTGNSIISSSDELDGSKYKQIILHSEFPKANVQSHSGSIGKYKIANGSKPIWSKID